MRTVNLLQGTDAWHQHRDASYNASEAPAMMGLDCNGNTRTKLIRQKATGIKEEPDAITQQLYDDGHKAEALARPLAEQVVGEGLSPIVVADDVDGLPLSASLDGSTFGGDVIFEHKALNNTIREALDIDGSSGNLPACYRIQMEQQLMLSGAEKCLFMASKWNLKTGELLEEMHTWYTPDLDLRRSIVAGWKQFAVDVANYQHVEAKPEVVAAPVEALPALIVQVEGRVLATNLDVFKEKATSFIAGIKTALVSDQDFADADKMVKFLGDGEKQLAAVKQQAQAQAADIDAVFRTIDGIGEQMRATRLKLEKLVKAEKENRKSAIVNNARLALAEHYNKLNHRIGGNFMPPQSGAMFAEAIKGLKSLASMQDAVDTALARAKIESNEIADRIEVNKKVIDALDAALAALFPDKGTILLKEPEDFNATVYTRVEGHKQRQEAERERIRKEEAARLEREAATKQAAETRQPTVSHAIDLLPAGGMTGDQPIDPAKETQLPIRDVALPDLKTRLDEFFASVGTPKAKQANYRAVIMAWEEFKAGHDMEAAA